MPRRSSRPEVFYKKGVLRNKAKFTRKLGVSVCCNCVFVGAGVSYEFFWLKIYNISFSGRDRKFHCGKSRPVRLWLFSPTIPVNEDLSGL